MRRRRVAAPTPRPREVDGMPNENSEEGLPQPPVGRTREPGRGAGVAKTPSPNGASRRSCISPQRAPPALPFCAREARPHNANRGDFRRAVERPSHNVLVRPQSSAAMYPLLRVRWRRTGSGGACEGMLGRSHNAPRCQCHAVHPCAARRAGVLRNGGAPGPPMHFATTTLLTVVLVLCLLASLARLSFGSCHAAFRVPQSDARGMCLKYATYGGR
ncbi:hypothetical protein C8Q78DRAFT_393260 [Trametes maxima]|nr:hypothetical protein C8Q78DRAFT_393260 [Trametes maxima]